VNHTPGFLQYLQFDLSRNKPALINFGLRTYFNSDVVRYEIRSTFAFIHQFDWLKAHVENKITLKHAKNAATNDAQFLSTGWTSLMSCPK
jgi:hypothetical protein